MYTTHMNNEYINIFIYYHKILLLQHFNFVYLFLFKILCTYIHIPIGIPIGNFANYSTTIIVKQVCIIGIQ